MSRLSTLSPQAIKAMYSPESDDSLIALVTIYNPANNTAPVVRLADNFTTHFTTPVPIGLTTITNKQTDAEEIIYGVIGPANEKFIFLPMGLTLPDETAGQSPKCTITLFDVAGYLTPLIREISDPPLVKIQLVLASNPTNVEITFTDFYMTNISYTRESVQAELNIINLDREPFPQHKFTPAYFPGLF